MREFTTQERWWYWSLLGLIIVCGLIGRITAHEPAGAWWVVAMYSVGSLVCLLLVRVTYRLRSSRPWVFPFACVFLVGMLLALKEAIEKAVPG